MTDREKILVEAVARAKRSQFGLTGVKVELEAVFKRGGGCLECDGDPEQCDCCDGAGDHWCEQCEGEGEVNVLDGDGDPTGNTEECDECEGDGRYNCDECDNNGYITCGYCDSNGGRWTDLRQIHDVVLEKLSKHGLAEKIPQDEVYDYARVWRPKAPLVFSKVYDDASVDTEQTFTLLLDKDKDILLLPKFLEAFTSLKDEIGNGIDVTNAGMHITLLNSQGAEYPSAISPIDLRRFENFRKSMILLMPALFFLGSANHKSRSMQFRRPRVERSNAVMDGKYSAIAYRNGGLEFRVFETCYDSPQTVLDDVLVALNCLRFWTTRYTRNYLAKVANNVDFGNDSGDELKRLYVTSEHIDLLNRGLRMIKPSYYTVSEVKAQRNFSVTKLDTRDHMKKARIKAEAEYKKYERRFGWDMVMQRHSYITRFLESRLMEVGGDVPAIDEATQKEAEGWAERRIKENETNKQKLDDFCKDNIPRLAKAGEYKLCVE